MESLTAPLAVESVILEIAAAVTLAAWIAVDFCLPAGGTGDASSASRFLAKYHGDALRSKPTPAT
jgi:hypothetical protein